ncbi:MAG: PLP-dependent transferase [Anaerolineae bacterium]
MDSIDKRHFETVAIHAGQEPDASTGALVTPVYQTATFQQDGIGLNRGYEYSRTGNPTRTALERTLAAIEMGSHALAFVSGMAAVDTVLRLLQPGDHVVAGNDVYGGTYRLLERVHGRQGLSVSWVDTTDAAGVAGAIREKTRLIWLETPSNPRLRLSDVEAVLVVEDNLLRLSVGLEHRDDLIADLSQALEGVVTSEGVLGVAAG